MQNPRQGRLPNPWPTVEPKEGWPESSTADCSSSDKGHGSECPDGGLNQISQWADGHILVGSSSNLTMTEVTNFQRLLVSHSLKSDIADFNRNVSRRVTTTPTCFSTNAIGGFWAYLKNGKVGKLITDSKYLTPMLKSTEDSAAYQPILYSQCHSEVYSVKNTSVPDISFDELQAPWLNNPKTRDFTLSWEDDIFKDLPDSQTRFRWNKASTLSTTSTTIVPIQIPDPKGETFQGSLIVICLFDARWAPSILTLKPKSSSVIETNITDFNIFEDDNIVKEYRSKELFKQALSVSELVEFPQNWLSGFNYSTDDTSIMAAQFDRLVGTTDNQNSHFFFINDLGTSNSTDLGDFADYQNNVTDFVGTFQSTWITDGMARFGSQLWKPYVERRKAEEKIEYFNLVGSNWLTEGSLPEDIFLNGTKKDSFSMEFVAFRYGYGYGFRSGDTSRSIYLAISVLGLHLVITLCYMASILYLCYSGRYTRSQSWEAIPNLVALTENSQMSNYLSGTSAGIEKKETWKLNVKVRVMEDERLSLVFAKPGEDVGELPRVEKKYD